MSSNFAVFKSRHGREEYLFVGTRKDRWVRHGDGWKLAERMVLLDHNVIDNVTMLF